MLRPYREIRKDYILSRTDTILRGSAGRLSRHGAKEAACREFDELVQQERENAVAEMRQDRDRLRLELDAQSALDTSSSVSRQHYIDTGQYLAAGLVVDGTVFNNSLAAEIFNALSDRETPEAAAAAQWVKVNENDALWDRIVGPMLDEMEKVAAL